MPFRLVFMGTPDFAVHTLSKLAAGGHHTVAVYTRPPKPGGRGMEPQPSAVAREAERLGLPILTPKTLRSDDAAVAMRAHGADAAVVVAYGLKLPKAILDAFPLGCFNLHASLLPRWRGAAPIHRAIMAGDKETGVRVMKMDEGLDTGPVAIGRRVQIGPNATAGELHDELAPLGAELMLQIIAAFDKRRPWKFKPQSKRRAPYAAKIDKKETRIDWSKPCKVVHNHCRGLSPFPGAWFEIPNVGRVKVLRTEIAEGEGSPGCVLDDGPTIACHSGAVRLVELQRAGGRAVSGDAFWRGISAELKTVLT
jgi:methionyl-tRNA formyltransferase